MSVNDQPKQSPSSPTFNREVQDLVMNVLSARQEILSRLLETKRDVNDECDYPKGIVSADYYQELFDREAIAARVVQVLPRESWQVQPSVYEDEDPEVLTPFEEAWKTLGSQLRGETSWYYEEECSPIWEYLRRVDELSGIGQFGILLLGINDGRELNEPVEGIEGTDYVGPYALGDMTPTMTYGDPLGQTKIPVGRSQPSKDPEGNPDHTFDVTTAVLDDAEEEEPPVEGEDEEESDPADPFGKSTKPKQELKKLLFIRAFPESLVQITQFESCQSNPRFGQPVMYSVTLSDPRQSVGGIGLPMATVNVHWTRVIHVADNLGSSEVFGVPRMRPVLNRLLDLRKLYSGSAEMYWRGAFPGYSLETQPSLGGDVPVNTEGLRDMWENYQNGLQRALFLMGMTAKSLAPQVVDPTPQINVQLEAICILLGIPMRVFKGTERGEMASSQDDAAWNDRLRLRQRNYITPRLLVQFIDRLIATGVLPEPTYEPPPDDFSDAALLEEGAMDPETGEPLDPAAAGMEEEEESGVPGKPPFARGGKGKKPPPGKAGKGKPKGKFPPKKGKKPPVANSLRRGKGRLIINFTDPMTGEPQQEEVALSGGYTIEWPDLTSQTPQEKANVAAILTQAMVQYVSGGVEALILPQDFLTKVLGMNEDDVKRCLQRAERVAEIKAQEEALAEQQRMADLAASGIDQVDSFGNPVVPMGEQVDEDGNPLPPAAGPPGVPPPNDPKAGATPLNRPKQPGEAAGSTAPVEEEIPGKKRRGKPPARPAQRVPGKPIPGKPKGVRK